jgi:hypothetical protein
MPSGDPFVKRAVKELPTLIVIAVCSGLVGVGIGFVQGEVVTTGQNRLYQVAFAEGAAMIGGIVALFLGPILYYVLHRRISFEQFCYIASLTAVCGSVAGWLFSKGPDAGGWWSAFVTPVAAVLIAVRFTRQHDTAAS